MANRVTMVQGIQSVPPLLRTTATIGGLTLLLYFTLRRFVLPKRPRIVSNLPQVPVVPGVPVIGNLLQLKEKKPYKTFLKWAQSYGPIYSIKTGSSTLVVLNSTEVAKEAMVTRFSSISTRKLSKALTLLTANKCMVAMSDYDDFHKTTKRYILANVLGSNAQKRHRDHRDTLRENVVKQLRDHVKEHPDETVNFREIFESELFALALKQALGKNVKSIYVEELGCELSREEIFRVLVNDMMEGAIEVDWRDFFPYLKWIPNKSLENKLARMVSRRQAVMKALIDEQKKRIASGQELNCFIDYLLSEDKALTEEQISMLLWETIIETSDTTFITAEWAMYELAKNPELQDRLCREIESVFGSEKVSEDRLSQAPLLMAVFHETLRKYSPAPIIPLRYAHEDTQLGGYHIPAGTEIAINIYGCNMDEKQWESPEKWNPDRFFVNGKYEVSDLHKTMAFGAGKRVCAGSLQAMLIACTIVGTMVHDFVWKLKDAEEENVDTISLTTRKLYPLQPFISPRTTA